MAERRSAPERRTRRDSLDVSLCDPELHAEVEMTLSLIVAANDAREKMSTEDIDRVLGVRPIEAARTAS